MADKKAKIEKKNFALLNEKGEEVGTYAGAQPRDAALKAANKGIQKIILKEKNTKRLHHFLGERKQVPVPADAPAWIAKAAATHGGKIWKANVEKVGVTHLEFVRMDKNEKAVFKFPAKKAKK